MYQNYNPSSYGGSGSVYNSYSAFPSTHTPSHASTTSSAVPSSGVMSHMNETAAVALLQHLDKDELQTMLDDDSKLQSLIMDLSQVKTVQQEHDNVVATNKSLAEYNLSLQPRIEDLKQYVATEHQKVNSLKTDLGSHKAKLDTFVGRQSLDTLHALLQTETAKSEEECEDLAEKFCNQELEMEDFLTEFLPKRSVAHLRRIKSERLAELIRDTGPGGASCMSSSSSSTSWSAPNPPPRPNPPSRPPYPDSSRAGSNMPPYPLHGYGMPQLNYSS